MKAHIETLPGGTRLYTTPDAPLTTDALLLAAFCTFRPGWAVCELGCGNGAVLLSLVDCGLRGPVVGVDCQPQALALLEKAVADGHISNVQAACQDLRGYKSARLFDMVLANPPYHTSGRLAQSEARALARHQLGATLQDFCTAAARLLKQRGRFCLCYPARQLAALFAALQESGLQPKRLQLVRKTPAAAPRLALIQARKAAGPGLEILPDIVLAAAHPAAE
ncbi:MAG: tRNA1(Val) (adenine(37)-N6)-methyltransferase [Oscillospiraceae bacterium]